jgi:hypothetical protein
MHSTCWWALGNAYDFPKTCQDELVGFKWLKLEKEKGKRVTL